VQTSGIATVGHGWAHAHPTSARVGHEICINSKSFGAVGWGGVADSAWAWRYTVYLLWTHHENAFVHCRLYMHVWLLGALPPDPHRGSAPVHHWDFRPQTPCAHPTSKPCLCHWFRQQLDLNIKPLQGTGSDLIQPATYGSVAMCRPSGLFCGSGWLCDNATVHWCTVV